MTEPNSATYAASDAQDRSEPLDRCACGHLTPEQCGSRCAPPPTANAGAVSDGAPPFPRSVECRSTDHDECLGIVYVPIPMPCGCRCHENGSDPRV